MSLEKCIRKHSKIVRISTEGYDDKWVDKYLEFWKDLFNEWRNVRNNFNTMASFFEEIVDELISLVNGSMKKEHFQSKEGEKYLIDPFTVIYSIHSKSNLRRMHIRRINKDYELPTGSGQPAAPAQNRYFFEPSKKNIDEVVPKLWEFGEIVIGYNTIDDLIEDISNFARKFKEILSIHGIGIPKLTQGMFLLNPKVFCPYDNNAKEFSKICDQIPKEKDIKRNPETYVREYLTKIHNLKLTEILKENEANQVKYKTVWFSNYIYHLTRAESQSIEESEYEEREDGNLKSVYPEIETLLGKYGQIVLYGPPGTGKTFLALKYAKDMTSNNKNLYDVVTFHPSYSYEEFIEGYRPITDENGKITYSVEDGVFKHISLKAFKALLEKLGYKKYSGTSEEEILNQVKEDIKEILENNETLKKLSEKYAEMKDSIPRFYLIIDEINRGDLARIFGELITCLEMDKRLFGENCIPVTLPYSKELFAVPPNLYIIGTMNTADKSIALVDYALRRRFAFLEMPPNLNVLEEEAKRNENEDVGKLLKEILEILNERIEKHLDRDHRIGHSYFLKVIKNSENEDDVLIKFKEIWIYRIMPLLQEYFYNRLDDLAAVLGGLSSIFLHKDDEEGSYYLKDPSEWQEGIDKINNLKEFLTQLKAESKSEASNEEEANEES